MDNAVDMGPSCFVNYLQFFDVLKVTHDGFQVYREIFNILRRPVASQFA